MLDRIHGGNIKEYLEGVSSYGHKLIDFSANINPLGLSPKAQEAVIKNIQGVIHYPEPDSKALKKALGIFWDIGSHNIAVGNGSIELIYLIPRALKLRRVLIITPTFSEYEFAVESNSSKAIFFKTEEEKGFKIDLHQLAKLIPKADSVFLGNPNNPTGGHLSLEEISFLARECKKYGSILIVDEAFMDFVRNPDGESLILEAARNKNLLVLRSLTKFFALPGLRIGYAVGHPNLIKSISGLQYPWNVNSLAQAAAERVLRDKNYINKSREYVTKERRYLFGRLKSINGLRVYSPSSNFIFCKLAGPAIKSAEVLNQNLLKKGMVVRNCSNFRGLDERFFRVAVRRRAENLKLIKALKEVL